MKSIGITDGYGLDKVTLIEEELPTINSNEVLVKVSAISLNQLDVMLAKGAFEKALPHILGSDAFGIVEKIGNEVSAFKIGDRVCTHYIQAWQYGSLKSEDLKSRLGIEQKGVFSEYIAVPEHYLVKAPSNVTSDEAAALPLAGVTAWEAIVNIGQLKLGQSVLLQGTGGVSIFALQFAKAIGAKVIILSSNDEKLSKAKVLGADVIINSKTNPKWAEEVLLATQGLGVDLALEMSWAGIGQTLQSIKFGGRIAVVGMLGGMTAELSVLDVMLKSISITAVQAGSKSSFESMNQFIEANDLKTIIDKVFPLSQSSEALNYFDQGKHFGKVVIAFR
ncbi:zinc-dependent alcohol dehydrogenase family protein [Chryseobacterium hispalense]|uniref:zinc-dependent alcohol dehydrogenase family protein n=1 Tax=Chryseobacterium hispalense TaxID=1453492 RepID=UPI00049307B5|nr:NAD(P)-dependent alcohol dehydrogenase [Chryseobacterium hispalense]